MPPAVRRAASGWAAAAWVIPVTMPRRSAVASWASWAVASGCMRARTARVAARRLRRRWSGRRRMAALSLGSGGVAGRMSRAHALWSCAEGYRSALVGLGGLGWEGHGEGDGEVAVVLDVDVAAGLGVRLAHGGLLSRGWGRAPAGGGTGARRLVGSAGRVGAEDRLRLRPFLLREPVEVVLRGLAGLLRVQGPGAGCGGE